MTDTFIHPETGEVLSTKEEFLAALVAEEERLTEVYRVLGPLREAHAKIFPPAPMPSRVNRTEKQEKIARCPRCGERLKLDSPASGPTPVVVDANWPGYDC